MNGLRTLFLAAAASAAFALPASPGEQSFEQIESGRYLTVAADCAACHTAPGGKPFAGGLTLHTPFGPIVSPNITPDRETGIGAWSDVDFLRAMKKGIDDEGHHLYPAFPYPYFTKMTANDILAIRAYLNTITPVQNKVHANQLPFPFNIRASLIAWNALFFKQGTLHPDPNKPAEWNRGAYLVEGPGHCGACHTPKGTLGNDQTDNAYQGGSLEGWYAPDLTGDPKRGLGRWSVDDVVEYLKTGQNRNAAASGPMAEVVKISTSQMTDADLHAIAVYLKSLPGTNAPPAPVAANDQHMQAGAAVYKDNCSACHQDNGAGIPNLFPGLAGDPNVQSTDTANLMRMVLQGSRVAATPEKPTEQGMPTFSWKLTDDQIADVLTYVRNSWGNAAPAVGAGDVSAARKSLTRG